MKFMLLKSAKLIFPLVILGAVLIPIPTMADGPPCCTVFLPLIFGAPAEPTPLPPTDPLTGTVQTLWPVKAVGAGSSWEDYETALAGSPGLGGTDSLYPDNPPETVVYSFINQAGSFPGGTIYSINRKYVEFDTTAIPADFETAQFNFTIYMPYPGPPAHHVAVHRGTWPDDGLTDTDHQFLPENWSAYEPTPLTILPGGDPDVAEWQIVSVTLPRDVINPGGITKLALRSTVEGTVPDTHLGGAFAGLSLTVK